MKIDALATHASHAMVLAILREVEATIKGLKPDTSATAPEHVAGFEAGFRACKSALIDALVE